jgi:hypothetical protein
MVRYVRVYTVHALDHDTVRESQSVRIASRMITYTGMDASDHAQVYSSPRSRFSRSALIIPLSNLHLSNQIANG